MARKAPEKLSAAERRERMSAAMKRSVAERYCKAARLLPTPEQETCMARAARVSAKAWNYGMDLGRTVYQAHKSFAATLDGLDVDRSLCREVAHCALRDLAAAGAMGEAVERKDPKTLIQFRVGGRLAYLDEHGLNLGIGRPVAMAEHDVPLRDFGSPYVVGVRIAWTLDGWNANFMLRDDPDGALVKEAFRRGSH